MLLHDSVQPEHHMGYQLFLSLLCNHQKWRVTQNITDLMYGIVIMAIMIPITARLLASFPNNEFIMFHKFMGFVKYAVFILISIENWL